MAKHEFPRRPAERGNHVFDGPLDYRQFRSVGGPLEVEDEIEPARKALAGRRDLHLKFAPVEAIGAVVSLAWKIQLIPLLERVDSCCLEAIPRGRGL